MESKVLLASGVSVDVVDNKGQTPIHWALQYPSGFTMISNLFFILSSAPLLFHSDNQKCVQLLISEGADPKGKDDEGLTGQSVSLIWCVQQFPGPAHVFQIEC